MPAAIFVAITLALGLIPLHAHAQPPQAPTANDAAEDAAEDEDPRSLVIFNLRLQHAELGDGNSADLVLLRRDAALRRPRRPGVRLATLRWDLPVGHVHVNGDDVYGLGDLYFQALNFRTPTRSFALGSGLAFQLPTATDDLLGSGKWQVAPTFIPLWTLKQPRGLFFTKVQDFVSVAGADDRRDVHYLTVTPTFIKLLGRGRAVLFDTEGIADWERDDQLRWKSGVLFATRLSGRRALWVKLEAPWGEHRVGEWTIRTSIAWRKKEAAAKAPPP